MTHDEIEGLVPLLALDALSPPEELSVRTHVEGCPGCTALLREHLETAAGLALLARPAAPPAGLRARLMAEVSAGGEVGAEAGAPPLRTDPSSGPVPAPSPGPGPGPAPWLGARLIPSSRWRRTIAGLAAACLLLAAVNYVIGQRLARQDRMIAQQKEILDLISGQPAMILAPTREGAGTTGHVFVKDGKAAVVLTGLNDSAEGVYELWVIRGGRPSPLETVERADWQKDKGEAVVLVERWIEDAEGMAVSLEPSPPAASSSAPRGPILLKT
jgi:hypothetical protein